MLDLSKGFDVLNINILLHKLKKYGITDSTYNWFQSYTTSRQQYVCVNHATSIRPLARRGPRAPPPPHHITKPIFFQAPRYTEHEMER